MLNVRTIENEVHFRPRPNSIPGYHIFSNDEFSAFVHEQDVLATIARWALQNRSAEIAGRIAGRAFRDDQGYWCVVTGALLADFSSDFTSVTTTQEDAAITTRALNEQHPTEDPHGWFHSHPMGLDEYSTVDKSNQSQWKQPYHLGLLVSIHVDRTLIHAFLGPESEKLSGSYSIPACDLFTSRTPDANRRLCPRTCLTTDRVKTPEPYRRDYTSVLLVVAVAIAFAAVSHFMTRGSSKSLWPIGDRVQELEQVTKRLSGDLHQHNTHVETRFSKIERDLESHSSTFVPKALQWACEALTRLNNVATQTDEVDSTASGLTTEPVTIGTTRATRNNRWPTSKQSERMATEHGQIDISQ